LQTPTRETLQHSSSGVIVSTGTGSTGWARSISLERRAAREETKETKRYPGAKPVPAVDGATADWQLDSHECA
jgi:hypothetical protein